jgi:4-carboxymuconolactone decarboxylase
MTIRCPAGELLPGVAGMTTEVLQRIPFPTGNEEAHGVYGRLTNGQRLAGHLPQAIQEGSRAFSGSLLRDGRLPPSLREMIIVRVGYHTNSVYEVEQHRSLAMKFEVEERKLDALACKLAPDLSEAESAVIAFVDELITANRPSDSVLDRVRSHFDDGELLEMIFVTGNWWTLSRMLETAGIPLEERRIGDETR